MKKILIMFIVLCYSFILFAGAEITFDNLIHDYGTLEEDGGPYEHIFHFSNTGDAPFKLVQVKAGWGCTTPSWSTDEIKAGEKGFITVAYKSENRPGIFNKSIKVFTDIDDKITSLRIKGDVIATPGKLRQKIGILKSSKNTIQFGDIIYLQSKTQKIEIQNTKSVEITISVEDCPDHIKLEIEPATLAPGKRGEILVTYDSKIKNNYGTTKDIPKISMNMGKQVYKGSFNIIANIVEDFSKLSAQEMEDAPVVIFPKKSINVGEIGEKQVKSIEFEFENHGKNKLIIRNIEINNNAFILARYDDVVEPGGKGKLTMKTNPAYLSSRIDTKINVITNDPRNSITILRLFGTKNIPKRPLKESKKSHSKSNNVKVHEVVKLMEEYKKSEKLVILDVRTPEEYENGCLPGALNIDIQDKSFYKTIKPLDKSKMYIVYCKSGIRSEEAISVMNKLGFKNVLHMFEGMDGWKDKRLKVRSPNK